MTLEEIRNLIGVIVLGAAVVWVAAGFLALIAYLLFGWVS